mgnify:FL=1
MPEWVRLGANEYIKRLKEYIHFNLHEIALQKRTKTHNLQKILTKESASVISALPANAYVIALDVTGKKHTSEQMAAEFKMFAQNQTSHVCFIIGGPEGHDANTLRYCHERWSLSCLTMAHSLVRVVFLEALYRTFTIIDQHPYHK